MLVSTSNLLLLNVAIVMIAPFSGVRVVVADVREIGVKQQTDWTRRENQSHDGKAAHRSASFDSIRPLFGMRLFGRWVQAT